MARKNKPAKFYTIENIEIESLSSEAKGIYRNDGKVIFIENALPGDIVDIESKKSSKNFEEAKLLKIHKASPLRKTPHCVHFEWCGGCKTQHLSYTEQLKWKTQVLKDALIRLAQIPHPEPLPILGCEITVGYRNKLDFACSSKRWLTPTELQSLPENTDRSAIGFHKAGFFDKIVDIEACHHMPPLANSIRNEIKLKSRELGLSFFDIKNQKGLLRNIMFRNSTLGQWMVCFSVTEFLPEFEELLQHISNQFPEITSLLYTLNTKGNDTIYDLEIITYKGQDAIFEQLGNYKFKVGPKSFFQTNSTQCVKLYDKILEMAEININHIVYDLYCGVGSIGIYLSGAAKKIVGIELVPEAIEDAKINVALNNIENCEFFAADMRNLFSQKFVDTHGQPDIIIVDPPRAGMHPDVVAQLLEIETPRIVYVSCNPQKLATELKELYKKYEVTKILPVDMFPHTPHLETIAVLDLRK